MPNGLYKDRQHPCYRGVVRFWYGVLECTICIISYLHIASSMDWQDIEETTILTKTDMTY